MKTIGDRIRATREDKNISRVELARAAGIGVSTLSDLELGLSKSTTKLHRIAEYLQLRPEWLETGRGKKEADPVEESQVVGIDPARLDLTTKFLEQLFESYDRVFNFRDESMLIARVYQDLSQPSPPNMVSLTKKYGPLLAGEDDDERKGKTGSTGEDDRGAAGGRARKAKTAAR